MKYQIQLVNQLGENIGFWNATSDKNLTEDMDETDCPLINFDRRLPALEFCVDVMERINLDDAEETRSQDEIDQLDAENYRGAVIDAISEQQESPEMKAIKQAVELLKNQRELSALALLQEFVRNQS